MKRLMFVFVMFATIVAFTGCSKDDEDENGRNSTGAVFKIFGKSYPLSQDDKAEYSEKDGVLQAIWDNTDDEDDIIQLNFEWENIDLDNNKAKGKEFTLNKEYTINQLGISLMLGVDDTKNDVDNITFYLMPDSKVTILESNPKNNSITLKFNSMAFKAIADNEVIDINDNFTITIDYKRKDLVDDENGEEEKLVEFNAGGKKICFQHENGKKELIVKRGALYLTGYYYVDKHRFWTSTEFTMQLYVNLPVTLTKDYTFVPDSEGQNDKYIKIISAKMGMWLTDITSAQMSGKIEILEVSETSIKLNFKDFKCGANTHNGVVTCYIVRN